MLDEDEYAQVSELYIRCLRAVKGERQERNAGLAEVNLEAHFRPIREAYSRLTGAPEMHHNAIMHHRIAIYGPRCADCGKPMRTPQARFCAACGRLSCDP